jgi:hypothetical protein
MRLSLHVRTFTLLPATVGGRGADPKLDRRCLIVRDANGQTFAYVYFEDEPGRRICSDATHHPPA